MFKMKKLISVGALLALASQAQAALLVFGNGMVYDDVTQLTWAQSPQLDGKTWQGAQAYADAFELNGLSNWRLPKLTADPNGCSFPCLSLTSELSDMYLRNLGFLLDVKPNPLSSPIFGSFDVAFNHDIFWLSDARAGSTGEHYGFIFSYENSGLNIYGRHSWGGDSGLFGTWVVTDEYRPTAQNGNSVPVPGTLLLAGLGLLALCATAKGGRVKA
jgi:hypothetical protein